MLFPLEGGFPPLRALQTPKTGEELEVGNEMSELSQYHSTQYVLEIELVIT